MPRKDTRSRAAYLKQRRLDRIARGICIHCTDPATRPFQQCAECRRCLSLKRRKL